MRYLNYLFILLVIVGVTSCDEGRIEAETIVVPQEGFTLKLTGNLSGMDSWPEKYSIVIAGFSESSEYAVISKVVPTPSTDDGAVEVTLSGIGETVTSLELCVINRLRKRVVTFESIEDFTSTNDTIYMEAGTVNTDMFNAIQEQVFDNYCIGCHGNSTSAAAGLYLTEGNSYSHLVNKTSSINSEMLLVSPGDAQNSFIYYVLSRNGDTRHDHEDLLSTQTTLRTMITDWINNGAEE